jgi:hypothetical protein
MIFHSFDQNVFAKGVAFNKSGLLNVTDEILLVQQRKTNILKKLADLKVRRDFFNNL